MKFSRIIKYYSYIFDIRNLLKLESNDILFAEFPKSGVTYYSFLISNYLCHYFKKQVKINFFNINDFVHDIHRTNNLPNSPFFDNQFPRLVKSHTFPKFLRISKSIIIIRNPFDTFLSYFKHLQSRSSFNSSFESLIKNKHIGINSWINFYSSILQDKNPLGRAIISHERNVLYPENSIETFCYLNGINFCNEAAAFAIKNSSRAKMVDLESKTSLVGYKKPEINFVSQNKKSNLKLIDPFIKEEMKLFINKKVERTILMDLLSEELKKEIFNNDIN